MEYTDVERQIIANQKELKILMLRVLQKINKIEQVVDITIDKNDIDINDEDDLVGYTYTKRIRDTQHIEDIYKRGYQDIIIRSMDEQFITDKSMEDYLKHTYPEYYSTLEVKGHNKTYNFYEPKSINKYILDVVSMYHNIWLSMSKDGGYHKEYNGFEGFDNNYPISSFYYKFPSINYYEKNKNGNHCTSDTQYIDKLGRYWDILNDMEEKGVKYPKHECLNKEQIKYIEGIDDSSSDYYDSELNEDNEFDVEMLDYNEDIRFEE